MEKTVASIAIDGSKENSAPDANQDLSHSLRDFTAEIALEYRDIKARIARLATNDVLTGLPNRTGFINDVEHLLKQSPHPSQIGLMRVDADDFKDVNTRLGHGIGDNVIGQIAGRLKALVGTKEIVGRLGGAEFAILVADPNRSESGREIAEEIIEELSQPYIAEGHEIHVSFSGGIAALDAAAACVHTLLRNADLAMRRAKVEASGTCQLYDSKADLQTLEKQELMFQLREAIASDQLFLHYQPIIKAGTLKIAGFEALVRWQHPDRGLIPPNVFIPLAEENGLIHQIGEWVLQKACIQAAQWPDNLYVAVNFSGSQFARGEPAEQVKAALNESGLSGHRLQVEITESILINEEHGVLGKLERIKALGALIAMDDFGTGFSSLSYLSSFCFDKIKVDRSFVKDLPESKRSLNILRSIAGLGRTLNMQCTVEGVENEEQLAIAVAEECNEIQGFFFSKPVAEDAVPSLIAQYNTGTGGGQVR